MKPNQTAACSMQETHRQKGCMYRMDSEAHDTCRPEKPSMREQAYRSQSVYFVV